MPINQTTRSHHLAIILALAVGLVSIAPQIFAFHDRHYKGIQMFGTDAVYFYVGEINRAQYENYNSGAPFPPDPGKNYYLAPKLGQRIMAVIAKTLHVGAAAVNTSFKFLGPAALFLVVYFWLLEMSAGQIVALMAPLFVILGANLLNPADILRLDLLRTN